MTLFKPPHRSSSLRPQIKGWADETAKRYNINSTPSTWLVDREGILRHINLKDEALTRAIEKLL